MSDGKIPESIAVTFRAAEPRGLRSTARTLTKLGAKRSSDVVFLPRTDLIEAWQSDALAHICFHLNGVEQFLDEEEWNELVLEYPVATVPAGLTGTFVDFVEQVRRTFSLAPHVGDRVVDCDSLKQTLETTVTELQQRHFEPGSEELRRAIEAQHG